MKCLHEIQLWGIFSISDQVGRAHCGWCHAWAGVLGSLRKQAEQARRNKPVSSTPPFMYTASVSNRQYSLLQKSVAYIRLPAVRRFRNFFKTDYPG